jgi:hypothetical protein
MVIFHSYVNVYQRVSWDDGDRTDQNISKHGILWVSFGFMMELMEIH